MTFLQVLNDLVYLLRRSYSLGSHLGLEHLSSRYLRPDQGSSRPSETKKPPEESPRTRSSGSSTYRNTQGAEPFHYTRRDPEVTAAPPNHHPNITLHCTTITVIGGYFQK
ncbi:hypothetical protein GDO81_022636 [Engystomops pustulosus]|uniref:Uncharacterized protein n=1 Tax=Engystomops pustulosus TaxID=76066 RepID=A0AAV6ZEQ8_ENGPU|nr:hypothetical protein GDO81_022636 [Engystomops pustulosus]